MEMKATLRQVAREAQVSPATVSRMLTGNAHVSSALRSRITAAARKIGFRMDSPRNVAVLIPSYSGLSGYLSLLLPRLCDELARREFSSMILQLANLEQLNENTFCGAIAAVFTNAIHADWSSRYHLPMISVNNPPLEREDVHSVSSNEPQGIELALECFRRHGHTRIGMLQIYSGVESRYPTSGYYRQQSFKHFFAGDRQRTGIVRNLVSIKELDYNLSLLLAEKVTAILVCGESLGLPFCRALTDRGIRIPDDVSVIAYENPDVTPYCFPPLTAIMQDMSQLSIHAVNMLEKRLRGEAVTDVQVDYGLLMRSSVAERF